MSESGQTARSLTWNKDTVYALGVYRLVGYILGIWPQNCDNVSSKIQFFFVVMMQLSLNYNFLQEFTHGCISALNAVDIVGVFVETTVSVLKIFAIRIHRNGMNFIVESAVNDWGVIRDEKSRETMRKYAYLGRFVSIFQISIGYVCCVLFILTVPPTLRQTTNESAGNLSIPVLRNVLLGSGCLVIDTPFYLYLAFYVVQSIQLIITCISLIGCDAIFFGFAMHLCAQLEILNIGIAQLGHDTERKNLKKGFTTFVDRHNHLTYLVNLMEDTFHLLIFGQLAATVLHISLLGIKLLYGLRDEDFVSIVFSAITIAMLLRQIFVYSYAGDYLVSRTCAIREAAYNCCWYNFPPNLARDVMFVMVRSNGSFNLTAGKIFPMNIESFTSLLKTMMSFFSVLKLTIVD